MWLAAGKFLLSLLPKDRTLQIALFAPLGFLLLISLLIIGPSSVAKHVPLAEDNQYAYYVKAVEGWNRETGLNISWQDVIAIEAVVLEQDFTEVTPSSPETYKTYFIREEQREVKCPEPSPDPNSTETDKKEDKPEEKCYETVYYQRSLDEVLDILVSKKILTQVQKEDVYEFTKFALLFDDYMDENHDGGVSIVGDMDIREGAFAWPLPLKNNRITSSFGMRIHPITKIKTGHKGTDIAAAIGTEVYAMTDGVVITTAYIGTGGKSIHIQHAGNVVSKYLHLNGYAVEEGQKVKKGELIGYSGNTGGSTGPHLHFQLENKGTPIDPMKFY